MSDGEKIEPETITDEQLAQLALDCGFDTSCCYDIKDTVALIRGGVERLREELRDQNPKPPAESDEKLRDKLAKCAFPKPTPYWNNHGPLFSPNAVCKAVRAGFKTGWNAARANDPRVSELVEAVKTNLSFWTADKERDGWKYLKSIQEALSKFERREM